MSKIFHLELKKDNSHSYYGDLTILCKKNQDLGISKFSLDRFDFDSNQYENETCIIRKSELIKSKRK